MRPMPIAAAMLAASVLAATAQQAGFDRQPADVLDVVPPSARVAGAPGVMTITQRDCRPLPAAAVRERIIALAVQEWGYFGFAVVDRTEVGEENDEDQRGRRGWRERRRRGGGPGAARVAASIAGYWAVTPDGGWILDSQNRIWREPGRDTDRWRHAWSAAFVSWVMCESGLALPGQFRRAIAHHTYIDQAIRARDGAAGGAAFTAHDAGEVDITPGDLLCSARRPAYRTLAERRRQMGEGARTHCDIVVKVDEAGGRVLAIGGNVRGTVGLKALPAARVGGTLRVVSRDPDRDERGVFAHLQLGAAFAAADVFDASPAVQALRCASEATPAWRTAAQLVGADALDCAR